MAASHSSIAEVRLPVEMAVSVAERALLLMGATLVGKHMTSIFARMGANWKSWGEEINVSAVPVAPNVTRIVIVSESAFKMTLVDWGKNAENVSHFLQALMPLAAQAEMQAATAPKCGHPNSPGAKFCATCGARLV